MFAQTTREASLLIPDFPFFIYGSSWIYLALGLISTHLLLFQLTASPRQIGMHKSRRVYVCETKNERITWTAAHIHDF